jgi:folate-binding Fe-S cluster repair protein YgfZ
MTPPLLSSDIHQSMADTAFYCSSANFKQTPKRPRGGIARKFLQGQVTCNLNHSSDSHHPAWARCTTWEGRMSFVSSA